MGQHGFILTGHEVFYNNFASNTVSQVKLFVGGDQSGQVGIRSIDILPFAGDPNFFEMLIGTEEGHIFLGAIAIDN